MFRLRCLVASYPFYFSFGQPCLYFQYLYCYSSLGPYVLFVRDTLRQRHHDTSCDSPRPQKKLVRGGKTNVNRNEKSRGQQAAGDSPRLGNISLSSTMWGASRSLTHNIWYCETIFCVTVLVAFGGGGWGGGRCAHDHARHSLQTIDLAFL